MYIHKCLPEFDTGAWTVHTVDGTDVTWEVDAGAPTEHAADGTTEVTWQVTGADCTTVVAIADDVTNKNDRH